MPVNFKSKGKQVLKSVNEDMNDTDLEYFRQRILAELTEATQEIERLRGHLFSENHEKDDHERIYSWHIADVGSDVMHQEKIYYMIDRQNKLIKMLSNALERIKDRTYGLCVITGKPISRERLEAIPHTEYSFEAISGGVKT